MTFSISEYVVIVPFSTRISHLIWIWFNSDLHGWEAYGNKKVGTPEEEGKS